MRLHKILDVVQKRKSRFLLYIGIGIVILMRCIENDPMMCAKETDEISAIVLWPIENEYQKEGIAYYNCGVSASISVRKEEYDGENIKITAIPLDNIAEKSMSDTENEDDQGNYLIPGWEEEEREDYYDINFSFQEDGRWKFRIWCEEEQEYDSEEFIIDTKEPVLSVDYGEISNIYKDCSNVQNVNKVIRNNLRGITSSECEVYTKKEGVVTIEITENYFFPDEVDLKIYQIDYKTEEKKEITRLYEEEQLNWEFRQNRYILKWSPKEEGHFKVCLSYRDSAGWHIKGNSAEEDNCMNEGVYQGPVYTVDQTVPIIEEVTYQNEAEKTYLNRDYFVQEPVMKIRVIEENFNQADFHMENQMFYADGSPVNSSLREEDYALQWTSHYQGENRINEAVLMIKTQANHTVNMWAEDGSGRISDNIEERVTYDREPPVIRYQAERLQEGDVRLDAPDLCFLPFRTYRYFSKQLIRVKITAKDVISGISAIQCQFFDENGNHVWYSAEKKENEIKEIPSESLQEYQAEFVTDWDDFKGSFRVISEDHCGLQSSEIQGKGFVVESERMHDKVNSLNIIVPEAAFTDEENKVKYFNQSLKLMVTGEDSFSGIRELKISAQDKKEKDSEQKRILYARRDYTSQEDVIYSGNKNMTLVAKDFTESCQNNPIVIEAKMTDNAGHISTRTYDEYKIVLDCEKPKVSVTYKDNQTHRDNKTNIQSDKKIYYNHARTALVTVQDWNFDPDAVEWNIEGTNQNYDIGKWTGKGEVHQCEVVFYGDGEDYKIKLDVTDYAGNRTRWDEDQSFTIDKTIPEVELKMNWEDVRNGKYFSSPKKIFLTVKDQNLKEEDIKIQIDVRKRGEELSGQEKTEIQSVIDTQKKMTGKTRYDALLSVEQDGDYRISVQCKDMAGNVSEIIRIPEFTLDQTKPEMKIEGLEKGMAYSGRIAPILTCTDDHLNYNTFRAEIYRLDGGQRQKPVFVREKIYLNGNNGIRMRWYDLPHQGIVDGIYVLKISGEDYAGNPATEEEGIPFYVNRFGSIYSLAKSTEEIIDRTFLPQEEDIILNEVNVNNTDVHISVWKDNENRKDLSWQSEEEQTDYIITHQDPSRYQRGKKGWHKKEYRILKKNFEKEGMYQITLYSNSYVIRKGKKTVIRETTNEIKNKPIRFTVDKTPPAVQLSGVEEKIYKEKSHTFIVTALDNYELDYVEVKIHCEQGGKKDSIYRLDAKDFGDTHSHEIELEEYEGSQTISYKAWDRAGNCSDSDLEEKTVSCVISKKREVREYYKNQAAHKKTNNTVQENDSRWIMLAIIAVSVIGSMCILWMIRNLQRKSR